MDPGERTKQLAGAAVDEVASRFRAETIDFFPARKHFKGYGVSAARKDLLAGLNVMLVTLPQGIAYALIAGLPPRYGIFAAVFGGVIAALLGSLRAMIFGPTNAVAIMVFSGYATFGGNLDIVETMPVLVLMVGAILIAGAAMGLADLMQFVSRSVVVGYLTGAAVLIMLGQAPHALGIEIEKSGNAFDTAWAIGSKLPEANLWAAGLAGGSLLLWIVLRQTVSWLPGLAIVLVTMSGLAYFLSGRGVELATLEFASLSQNFFKVPSFELSWVSDLFIIAISVAGLIALQTTVMARALAQDEDTTERPNQDLFAVGVANAGACLVPSMPIAGSLTRAALNQRSGAKSPLASIVAGLGCLALAFTIGPLLRHISMPVMGGLIVGIGMFLIKPKELRDTFRISNEDAAVLVVTILATLLAPLSFAVFVGVCASVVLYLRRAAHLRIFECHVAESGRMDKLAEGSTRDDEDIRVLRIEGDLFFGSSEAFFTEARRAVREKGVRAVVLNFRQTHQWDATTAQTIERLIEEGKSAGTRILVCGLYAKSTRVMQNAGLMEKLGEGNVFLSTTEDTGRSTREAVDAARQTPAVVPGDREG